MQIGRLNTLGAVMIAPSGDALLALMSHVGLGGSPREDRSPRRIASRLLTLSRLGSLNPTPTWPARIGEWLTSQGASSTTFPEQGTKGKGRCLGPTMAPTAQTGAPRGRPARRCL
jgi:hypothetical protein